MTSAPTFGAERRGAPVTASTRLSADPIRVFSQIEHPDVVIVLDDTLLGTANAPAGMKSGGWLVVNSRRGPGELGIKGDFLIATADASGVAEEVGLIVAGSPMVNTAMLGAFARATGLISLENIEEVLARRFSSAQVKKNFDAARLTYERTRL